MRYLETSYGGLYDSYGPNSELESARDNLWIAFFPQPECKAESQYHYEYYFRALAFTYGVEIQLVYTPQQIFIPDDRPIISIEEERDATYSQNYISFNFPQKAIYILGNSEYQYPSDFMKCKNRVFIKVPQPEHPMYGCQAMAIILANKYWKDLNKAP